MPKYSEPMVGSLRDASPFELQFALTQAQQAISLVSTRLSAESGLYLLFVPSEAAPTSLTQLKAAVAQPGNLISPMRRWLPVDRDVRRSTVYPDDVIEGHAHLVRCILHLRLHREFTSSNRLTVATSALALMREHVPNLTELTNRLLNADWRAALLSEHRLRRPIHNRRDYAVRAAFLGTSVADQIETHPIRDVHSHDTITALSRRSHQS